MLRLRPSTLLIPFVPNARVLLWIAGVSVFAGFFYSCGARRTEGKFTAKQRADSIAYQIQRAEFAYQIATAELARAAAEEAYSRLAITRDSIASHVKASAIHTPRVRVVPGVAASLPRFIADSGKLVDVCLGDPPTCYPTPEPVAKVAQELDSIVHTVVIAQLIPAMEAERKQAIEVIGQYRNALDLERGRGDAAEFRVGQLELTVKALQGTSGRKRLETYKRVGLFVIGVYVGAKATRWVVSR